jgi:hypothetical protein
VKPPGIALCIDKGDLSMRVTRSTSAEDDVWRAVESWIREGRTPHDLKREIAMAWEHITKENLDHELKELKKT